MVKRGRGGRKKSGVSVEGAEFFKIFLPTFTPHPPHQLLIPPDFVKGFKKTMREKVILKNIHGKVWSVDAKETPDGVFLQGEWLNFVDYHGLKDGDFLVFRYDGCFTFIVTIFGPNGCKKDKFEPKNTEEKTPKEVSRRNEDHLSSLGRRRSRHSERFREVNEEEVGASEEPEKSEEFDDMDQEEEEFGASFFSLPGAHRLMKIPDRVMKKVNVRKEEQMFLRDEDDEEWPVKIFTRPDGMTFLGQGLHAFQVAKNGPKGCRFTFNTERSSKIIEVQVLR